MASTSGAGAASCAALLIPYQSAQALQAATASQVKVQVFDQIQRHNCPVVGLNLLDYYISVLRKEIAAYDAAYPCKDGKSENSVEPNEKKGPHEILDSAMEARQVCLRFLNARPVPVSSSDPAPVTMDQLRRSRACANSGSDITGTGGPDAKPTQKQADCREGAQSLKIARNFRKEFPALAPERFKKAADAYRRAGDVDLANLILAEMNALPLDYPDESEGQRNLLREAGFEQDFARKIEDANRTDCDGLRAALPHYADAARMFRDAKEISQANVNAERYRELAAHVDQVCRSRRSPPPPPPPPKGPDDWCTKALEAVAALEKLAAFEANMATAGTVSPDAEKHSAEAKQQRDALAGKGCK